MIEKLLEAQGPAVLSRKTSKCQLWSHLNVGNICHESGVGVILRYMVNKLSPGGLTGKNAEKQGNEKRSEEHTSELQSRGHLVCRLLLEKKKNAIKLVPN